jgi:hypothetical protein
MRRLLLLLCVALGGHQTAVAAEDYTKAVNAAWCTGVLAQAIERSHTSGEAEKRHASGKAVDLFAHAYEDWMRSLEQRRKYCYAFANGYFRENDGMISFVLLGRQSVEECTRAQWSCYSKYPYTSKDIEMNTERWRANKDC